MQKISSKLTVYFDDQFWVGVYERIAEDKLEVCKITFGPEPNNNDIYDFFSQNWSKLKFSPAIIVDIKTPVKINPKRLQRQIKRQIHQKEIGTKSQQALKQQQEENKSVRKTQHQKKRQEEKQFKYELRQQKRKEKHRGR